MSNIADLIEAYILQRLAAKKDAPVELKRTEIADKISCAPSQISYVLNTRFTASKGFAVESRRGLGGFIRITRIPLDNIIYEDMINKIGEETTLDEINVMFIYLLRHGLIAKREAAILMNTARGVYHKLTEKERADFFRSLFSTLADFSEGGV